MGSFSKIDRKLSKLQPFKLAKMRFSFRTDIGIIMHILWSTSVKMQFTFIKFKLEVTELWCEGKTSLSPERAVP